MRAPGGGNRHIAAVLGLFVFVATAALACPERSGLRGLTTVAAQDRFGFAVSRTSDQIVIFSGGYYEGYDILQNGQISIFTSSGDVEENKWELGQQLTRDLAANDTFLPYSGMISDDLIVVGLDNTLAPFEDGDDPLPLAILYTRSDDGSWTELLELMFPSEYGSDRTVDEMIGSAVTITQSFSDSGLQYVVICSQNENSFSGGAYVFSKPESDPTSTWTFLQRLQDPPGLQENNRFGFSILSFGDLLLVGSDDYNMYTGSVFVYKRSAITNEFAYLSKIPNPPSGSFDNGFGFSIAMSNTTLIIGAPYDDSSSFIGAAFYFQHDPSDDGFVYQQKIVSSLRNSNDYFGYAVGISSVGDVLVGVPNRDAAYLFSLNSSNLFEERQLVETMAKGSQFGSAISMTPSGSIVIGAFAEKPDDLLNVGNAYAYSCIGSTFDPTFIVVSVTAVAVSCAVFACCLVIVVALVGITAFNLVIFHRNKQVVNSSTNSSGNHSNVTTPSLQNSITGNTIEESTEMRSISSSIPNGLESSQMNFTSSTGLLDSTRSRSSSTPRIIIDSQTFEIQFEELEIISKLDSGAFGAVFRAKWNQDLCAVKKFSFDFDNETEVENFVREFEKEISLLGQLRHANILGFMGACTKPPHFAIVTELMENGSLYDTIHKKKLRIKWPKCVSIASNIASGMTFLHRKGIIHRDLKSKNILLDANFVGKVCDFGLARSTRQMESKTNSKMTQSVGTPLWMAPEVAMNDNYDNSCDVFSFGIILWELLTHKIPYDGMQITTPSLIYLKVASAEEFRPTIPDVTHDMTAAPSSIREVETKLMYIELMKKCWRGDPKQRPPFVEVLAELDTIRNKLKVTATENSVIGGSFLNMQTLIEKEKPGPATPDSPMARFVFPAEPQSDTAPPPIPKEA